MPFVSAYFKKRKLYLYAFINIILDSNQVKFVESMNTLPGIVTSRRYALAGL